MARRLRLTFQNRGEADGFVVLDLASAGGRLALVSYALRPAPSQVLVFP